MSGIQIVLGAIFAISAGIMAVGGFDIKSYKGIIANIALLAIALLSVIAFHNVNN